MISKLWPLAPLAAILAFGACDGGACGSEPPKSGTPQASSQVSGKTSGGGGDVNVADWDSRKQAGEADPAQARPAQTAAPTATKAAPLDPIGPAEWDARVANAKGPVLVFVTRADCEDCALARPVLRGLASDFPTWAFFSAEGLPNVDKPPKPPTFVIYEKGAVASDRQGLPFPRSAGELDADYQKRLSRWFRDALTQKNFKLAKR
jgi:hypothetical protein